MKYTKRYAYKAASENKAVAGIQQPVVEADPLIEELKSYYNEEELKGIIGFEEGHSPSGSWWRLKNQKQKIHLMRETRALLLLPTKYAEETVKASTVLGLNEFNLEISEQRIKNFFSNAIYMIKKKPVDNLVVGLLGDMIVAIYMMSWRRQTGCPPCRA